MVEEDNIDYQRETFNLRLDDNKLARRVRFDSTSLFPNYDIVKDIMLHLPLVNC